MRISDLSSDVCSSDLGLRFRARSPLGAAVRCRPPPPLHLRARLFLTARFDRRRIVGLFGAQGDRRATRDRKPGGGRYRRARARFRDRSEEHTSELQSLMRISYAVFCLKKKNCNDNKSTLHPIINLTTTI